MTIVDILPIYIYIFHNSKGPPKISFPKEQTQIQLLEGPAFLKQKLESIWVWFDLPSASPLGLNPLFRVGRRRVRPEVQWPEGPRYDAPTLLIEEERRGAEVATSLAMEVGRMGDRMDLGDRMVLGNGPILFLCVETQVSCEHLPGFRPDSAFGLGERAHF